MKEKSVLTKNLDSGKREWLKNHASENIVNEFFYSGQTEEEVVKEIWADFEDRRNKRKPFELSWLLNINFVLGNQYSYISSYGDLQESEKAYSWESREVFNHIAPIVESRMAKLNRVRPAMSVRPSGNEESDLETARLSKMVLDSVSSSLDLPSRMNEATLWSEVCGTSFYKVGWDWSKGNFLGEVDEKDFGDNGSISSSAKESSATIKELEKEVEDTKKENDEACFNGDKSCEESGQKQKSTRFYDGDVVVSVCSPFEIFPDSASVSDIDECGSIIHATTISEEEAKTIYGVEATGQTVDSMSFDVSALGFLVAGESSAKKNVSEKRDGRVYVIERYLSPSEEYPSGVLEIVVGDRLVYLGEIPSGVMPFVKQVSTKSVGCFWGGSVVERCIPVQRAYNAIKNRKIEFLSRISAGVLAVEEGSVDIDNLEEEGLAPGKILVYRNGSSLPSFLDSGDLPSEFSIEEDRLLNEFISLTGVSELMRNSALPSSVTSGTAINLLMEQDDTRLSVSAEYIRSALLELSKKILRLYKQNATVPKLARIVDNNGEVQIFYWQGSSLSADDVVLDTSNELSETPATRKNMVMELLKSGILSGEDGKIDSRTKVKVLDMLGFGNWEAGQDLASLQVRRAKTENLSEKGIYVLEIDDHSVHIEEHTKYLLEHDGTLEKEKMDLLLLHIREHKMFLNMANKSSEGGV